MPMLMLMIMMVPMVMVAFAGATGFGHGFFQQFIGGCHICGGLIQERGQAVGFVRLRSGGPFFELGGMVLVMFNPVGEQHTEFFNGGGGSHVRSSFPF